MKLILAKPSSKNTKQTSTQVVFAQKTKKTIKLLEHSHLETFNKTFDKCDKKNFQAYFGETLFVPHENSLVIVIGLGDTSHLSQEQFRSIGGTLSKGLHSIKAAQSSLSLLGLNDASELELSEIIKGLSEGILLSQYSYDASKNPDTIKKAFKLETVHLLVKNADKKSQAALQEAQIISDGVNFARFLGDSPGNLMTPDLLFKAAQKEAKGTKLKVTAWNKQRILKEKMGGLFSVSKGSDIDPRFIILEYKGAAASKKPICYVGKGLTFDAGGISIKPSNGMEQMKYDMCGGAAVIATMTTIAKLKLKVNAIAFVPSCENMPGPSANKPGDIITSYSGKTVEVNNTDAEGRLILMDALCYASKKKPAFIVDAATLTGAMVVSLGNIYTGVFSKHSDFVETIKKAAESSGENVWPMPLHQEHVKDMKGQFADLTNLAPTRGAGSSTAAAFLSNFVDEDIPWAHFDIAGTAWNAGGRLSYNPSKGATGSIVRTFVELAKLS